MEKSKLVGSSLPEFTFRVEKGKIREMALAIGDGKKIYTGTEEAKELGHRDVIAPPTFGLCIDLWGGPDFMEICRWLGLNPVKVLHGEQEFEYLGDICAGDEITVSTSLAGYTEKKSMHIFSIDSAYTAAGRGPVLKSRKTIIELQ
ncbi:hypothetical protein DCCM_2156 [Desulfocucumis palustris]|uniref:FAS1-like dehydratase domain-containing protein n=1 Tax=Desulfocucumis palustris TaxID=1898651 RepID=A0A2L2X9X6_9FIRM|nr:MaoC family dehydratase N-terminal domain-containing protein [Desulfocucumis palustris]GBF33059.1 hypothetical protein DCCM_2156 [Desulfocucumis palustris]